MFGSLDKETFSSPHITSSEIIGIAFGVFGAVVVVLILFCVKKRTLWPSLYKTRSTSTKQLDLLSTPSELVVTKSEENGSCGKTNDTQYSRVVRKPPEVGECALYKIYCTQYSQLPLLRTPLGPQVSALNSENLYSWNLFQSNVCNLVLPLI